MPALMSRYKRTLLSTVDKKTVRFGAMTVFSLSVTAFAFQASAQTVTQANLGQASYEGEKYMGSATPVPISESAFLSSDGLGFTTEPGLLSSNTIDEPFVEMAANIQSGIQHGDDGDLPGLHRPALPANQNPQNAGFRAPVPAASSVAVTTASGAAAAFSDFNQTAAAQPLTSASARPVSAPLPLPSNLIDTSNTAAPETSGFTSASARRASVTPATSGDIPSLTPADYEAPAKADPVLLDDDLSFPPVIAGEGLPLPEGSVEGISGDLPPQAVVVESAINLPNQNAQKTERDSDFAFVTQQLDKVGVDSQRLKVEVGTGMIARPTYVGSDDVEVSMIPHADIEYLDRIFVSTERGVGVTVFDNKTFDIDVFGNWRRGRKAEGDIRHFTEKKGGVAFGVEAGASFGPLRLSVNTDYGVSGDIGGLKADIDLGYRQAIGNKFTAGISVGTRFADAEYTDALFGATRTDYARSSLGIGNFDAATAGIVDFHGGLEAAYRFTPSLSLNLDSKLSILTGEAAASPIVESFGTPTQWQHSLTTRFKF